MLVKSIAIIFVGLSVVVAVLVLSWIVFVKREAPVLVESMVVSDNNQSDDSVDDSFDVEDDDSEIDVLEIIEDNDDNPNQKAYKITDISSKLLFVENSSISPMNAPYGTFPDNIHILDILKSNKPVVSIKTNILSEERTSYKLLGDRIYFFSMKDKMVEWMDFEGNIYKLEFTKVDDWTYSNYFLISPNNQKIVWVETSGWDKNGKMNSKLISADLDGKKKKVLLEKSFGHMEEKHFQPIKWSNSNEEIYFTEQQGGLGGYIIFSGPTNLGKINIITNKIEHLFETVEDFGRIGDISPCEKFIAYFGKDGNNPKLIIRNMETGEKNVFDIPINESFRGGGKAYFSPDSKHLVYNIAHWNPDDEYFRTVVVNSTEKEQKTIVDFQKIYVVEGWALNDKILLRDFKDSTYIIDIDGTNLKKIEIEE